MDDVRAVMDAAGSERAALLGISEGVPMSILFAATYPERVPALVCSGAMARTTWADDYPFGARREALVESAPSSAARTGATGVAAIERRSRRAGRRPGGRAFFGRMERATASPGDAAALARDVPRHRHARTCSRRSTCRRWCSTRATTGSSTSRTAATWRSTSPTRGWSSCRATTTACGTATRTTRPRRGRGVPHRARRTARARPGPRDGALHGHRGLDQHRGGARRPALARGARGPRRASSASRSSGFGGREVKTDRRRLSRDLRRARARRSAARARSSSVRAAGGRVRAGLHTGECEVIGDDIGGIAVHIAARVSSLAGAGEVLVSRTVKDLVAGSGIEFADRGEHELKGVPGPLAAAGGRGRLATRVAWTALEPAWHGADGQPSADADAPSLATNPVAKHRSSALTQVIALRNAVSRAQAAAGGAVW